MPRILESDPEEDERDAISDKERRKLRRRTLSASEVHPLPAFIHEIEDGQQRQTSSEIGTQIQNFKMRELQRIEDEAEMAELELLKEQRLDALEQLRARRKALNPLPMTNDKSNFEPKTETGKSFLSDPEVVRIVANLPVDKQAQFFQSIAAAELAERNPQMAVFNSLLSTYQKMTPQQAQAVDPIDLYMKVANLQKTMREQDPVYQQALNALNQQNRPQERVQTDPNSLTGILEKKLAERVANISIEELFGGAKPTTPTNLAAGGAVDAGTGLFLDEETGMYIPKQVNYSQYLDINSKREEMLLKKEEIDAKEKQWKMVMDTVVTPLIPRVAPIMDAVVNKAQEAIVNPGLPRQDFTPAQTVISTPVPAPPPGIIPPEENNPRPGEEFICASCKKQWMIYPDARGIWPQTIHCDSCNSNYSLRVGGQSPRAGAPPPKQDRPTHDDEFPAEQ